MEISFELTRDVPAEAEAEGIPVSKDGIGEAGSPIEWSFLEKRGFKAKPGEVMSCPSSDGRFLVALGVGPAGDVDAGVLRRAAAGFARAARRGSVVALRLLDALPEGGDKALAAQATAAGAKLGAYEFAEYQAEPEPNSIETVAVVGPGRKRLRAALVRRYAEA